LTLYYNVIKAFLDPSVYEQYKHVIDEKFLKENYPETYRVYQSLHALHRDGGQQQHYSVDDLALRFHTDYPNAAQNEFARIFQSIRDADAQPGTVHGYLNGLLQRQQASRIAEAALAVAEGNGDPAGLHELTSQLSLAPDGGAPAWHRLVATTDLELLHERRTSSPGLRWRLESLNKALGPLRQGNFGFVFARPETGKTTFLCSEVTHMASQTEQPILWFNNEQECEEVTERAIQATLGIDQTTLYARKAANNTKYRDLTGDRIKVIEAGDLTARDIEAICKDANPSLIIFDQVDKIRGFQEDRNDLELKAIYIWARNLAKKYAPVIAICQAGGSGENKRWLTMNDVDNSKTGKQGEADWILGIGKVHDDGLEQVRYFHLSKNKLPGGPETDPGMRHGQWEVKLNTMTGRYEDWA
jgi:hypothetical protein